MRGCIVGARVSALMVFAPFLASATIAPRIKAGFAVALTALLYPVVAHGFASSLRGQRVAGGGRRVRRGSDHGDHAPVRL